MTSFGFPNRPSLFSCTLRECRKLYVDSGELIAHEHSSLVEQSPSDYVQLMDDLHRGLVLKVYITVCEADGEWSQQERLLAEVLCHHLWGEWMEGAALRDTMKRASSESKKLPWQTLVRPFAELEPLHDRRGDLETLVTRLANLAARCDGSLVTQEREALAAIEEEILCRFPLDRESHAESAVKPVSQDLSRQAIEKIENDTSDIYRTLETGPKKRSRKEDRARVGTRKAKKEDPSKAPKESLEDSLAELEKLIGLGGIKHEVKSLTNFLRLQQRREAAGLPETEISLHMVFTGNPGTGKTTVARIVGQIFGALGVLEEGHLIETDRSGLVAEYAGQTGPKTNAKVDEAQGGLLFIDEAYSLVATGSEDPYGHEALQALLKRAEDDRDDFVTILAGYPDEMQDLLHSNPGLSSRFSRRFEFVDYLPLEMAQIFGLMCKKNRYELTCEARLKVMIGFQWLYDRRDRHFGNGRESRNLFEHSVRRMANRLSGAAQITQQQLVTLEAADIEFRHVPSVTFEDLDEEQLRLTLMCPACEHSKAVPTRFLGQRVKCPRCQTGFFADWGELSPIEVK